MRPFKPFWGWTQTHPRFYFPLPLPKVFLVLFSAPKFSPPKPKFIFSPPGCASFFSSSSPKLQGELRNVETQGSLELKPDGKSSSLKVSSLPSFPFLFFQIFFCWEENNNNNDIISFFPCFATKKMTATMPSSFFVSLFCCKEDDNNCYRLFFACSTAKKTTTIVVIFFLCFIVKKTIVAMSSSFFSLFCYKENNNSCHRLFLCLFYYEKDNNNHLFFPCFVTKKTIPTMSFSFVLFLLHESDNKGVIVLVFFSTCCHQLLLMLFSKGE